MTFLSPLAFLLFVLSLPLVALYFLKVRHRERKVSSLLLWDSLPNDRTASTIFKRFQPDPLLILLLLALLSLATALARPAITLMARGRERIAVVLDVSGSMKATDVSPSRFHVAQSKALAFVNSLNRGTEVMVLEAGIQPKVVVPFTQDRGEIASAIKRATPQDIPNRLFEALQTARSLTASYSQSRIHIFSDGALPDSLLAEFSPPQFQWVGAGHHGRNVGITNLAVRKNPYSTASYQAFVSLANFSDAPETVRLTLSTDDQPIARKQVSLSSKMRHSLIIPFSQPGAAIIQARLDVKDDLVIDNVAHAVISQPREIRVLLVSRGNPFLEKALRSDSQVKMEIKHPEEYTGGMGEADVVLLDNVSPPRIGPGRFILIHSIPRDVPLGVLGRLQQPAIMDWDRTHPVMQHIDLTKVVIEEALRIRPLVSGSTLVEAIGGPLIYALDEQDRKAIFVGFNLLKTDLPLRVAFPMILANSIRWLYPVGQSQWSLQQEAGQPLLLPMQHGAAVVTVRSPSRGSVELTPTDGLLSFPDTDRIGIYTISGPQGETRIAVNLANVQESNIVPRPLPQGVVEAGQPAQVTPVQQELWPIFVLLAAALLTGEAVLYWRREKGPKFWLTWDRPARRVFRIRAVIVLALLVCLLRPQVPRWVDRLNVAFLIDVSDSVGPAARERAHQYITRALQWMKNGDRQEIISFATEAVLEKPLSPEPAWEEPAKLPHGAGTNLAQAIQMALATLPSGQANRLVLLSDARQNMGDALAAARAAKEAGIEIYHVPPSASSQQQEVMVESLILPREVKFGEPFQARVIARSRYETDGRLSLFRDGQFIGSQKIRLFPGKNVFKYRQSLEQTGIHVYQASIHVPEDAMEENNQALASVAVRGRPKVMIAESEGFHARALAAALHAQNIEVKVVGPQAVPQELQELRKYDGLILSNISSLNLTQSQMESMRDYVKDEGGGLVMIGGEESFGLGGYFRTPIEEALPVTMEVKQKIEVPSLAVVLSIDRSGSMGTSNQRNVTKLEIAKEAAHLVVDLLDQKNEVGVLSWDTEFVWDVPLQQAGGKARINDAIATIRTGGGTDGYPALREAYEALAGRKALVKHVIFLSDGQMNRGDFATLLHRMAEDKITVSTVAIGTDSDTQLMSDIAGWGRGRYYYTEDSQTIPRIFTLETERAAKSYMVEQPFRVTVTNSGHEILQGIDWRSSPPLGGYVATTLKGSADMLLMAPQEDPLLAAWRYGLGRTIAFTSDAKAKWGVLWLGWRDFGRFWAQAVRWTLRTVSRDDVRAVVARRRNRGELMLDAVDSRGEFVNFLEAEAGVIAPDKQKSVLSVEQVGPGRYLGRFPASEQGVYLIGVAERKANRTIGSQLLGLIVPYAQEFRELGTDKRLLRRLSEITMGGELKEPKDAFLQARRRSRLLADLWPSLVQLAAVMLVCDVGLRRFRPELAGRLGGWFSRKQQP